MEDSQFLLVNNNKILIRGTTWKESHNYHSDADGKSNKFTIPASQKHFLVLHYLCIPLSSCPAVLWREVLAVTLLERSLWVLSEIISFWGWEVGGGVLVSFDHWKGHFEIPHFYWKSRQVTWSAIPDMVVSPTAAMLEPNFAQDLQSDWYHFPAFPIFLIEFVVKIHPWNLSFSLKLLQKSALLYEQTCSRFTLLVGRHHAQNTL